MTRQLRYSRPCRVVERCRQREVDPKIRIVQYRHKETARDESDKCSIKTMRHMAQESSIWDSRCQRSCPTIHNKVSNKKGEQDEEATDSELRTALDEDVMRKLPVCVEMVVVVRQPIIVADA